MENQLCDILRNMNASANFGRRIGVSFPIFDGSENEDVFEFLDKFKHAATFNGWNDDDLPISQYFLYGDDVNPSCFLYPASINNIPALFKLLVW